MPSSPPLLPLPPLLLLLPPLPPLPPHALARSEFGGSSGGSSGGAELQTIFQEPDAPFEAAAEAAEASEKAEAPGAFAGAGRSICVHSVRHGHALSSASGGTAASSDVDGRESPPRVSTQRRAVLWRTLHEVGLILTPRTASRGPLNA